MISRRQVGLGLAGLAATTALGGRPARAETPISTRKAKPTDVTLTGYALPTQWHPIKQLHNWPLDHTCVAASTGEQWGCFGRTYAEDPSVATAVAQGPGDLLWTKEIAGPKGYAGIDFGVTGVCDQTSNRILIPAGVTVKNSPGNEIATLLCGIYGLKIEAFITQVKDAAAAVNREHPDRITEEQVHEAVTTLGGGLKDEWALVRENNERLIKPVLGAQYAAISPDIDDVYLSFYYKRTALVHAYERGNIDKKTLVTKVSIGFVTALNDLRDVVGAANWAKILPIPAQDAADYVFYREKA
jgi:hypothetical protein